MHRLIEKKTIVLLFSILLYTPRSDHKGYKHFMKLMGGIYVGPRTLMAHEVSDAINQVRKD